MTIKEYKKLIQFLRELIVDTKYENHVFCCGGCVRDMILGDAIKDVDLCIDLPNGGIEFAEWICKEMGCYKTDSNPIIYPTYGTAKFNIRTKEEFKNIELECVQTRKEQYKDKNSRNPTTEYGTLEEDCVRRDLTINSMYMNISNGEILDLTKKGMNDIKNHVIRATNDPDVIFSDDALRMLRVIRFATRLGWGIEKNTYLGIIKNSERIKTISQERITDEISKILICNKPSNGIRHLYRCNLLDKVMPEVYNMTLMEQNKYHFGNVFEHTMSVLDKTKPILVNRLAALYHDVGKLETMSKVNGEIHFFTHEEVGAKMIEPIFKALKLPNDIIKKVALVTKLHMRLKGHKDNTLPSNKSIRKLQSEIGNDMELLLDVIHADNTSHNTIYCMPNQVKLLRDKLTKMEEEGKTIKRIELPINGNDLMKAFKLKSSPKLGKYLKILTDKWFENPKITKEECLDIISDEIKKEK